MQLNKFHIIGEFKNLHGLELDFLSKDGVALIIGNNGSGKSNILEALSSVFAGLYNQKFNPAFAYSIEYKRDNQQVGIEYDGSNYTSIVVEGNAVSLGRQPMPSQVICSYSGEDTRLWGKYYEPFYRDYTDALINGEGISATSQAAFASPTSQMVYINKYYWDVALLTFFLYDSDASSDVAAFCHNTLHIENIESIEFKFNTATIAKWQENTVTNFVKQINPKNQRVVKLSLSELKSRVEYLGIGSGTGERTFFRYLASAFLPKKSKLIEGIDIIIDGGLPATTLSEGEKKLLLIKTVLEIVSDEESLILLDEPDSHMHVSRKAEFQELIRPYRNRQNIITTHSPTLTKIFGKEHILMLTKNADNNVRIVDKEKQDIIHELSGGNWSYQQENIFLNSNSDILLLEGKYDEIYLKKALSVLNVPGSKYEGLEFEYLPCGGTAGVKLMSKKFKPKRGQNIIAILDNDNSGKTIVKSILGREDEKFQDIGFTSYQKTGDIWVALYPIKPGHLGGGNFIIEDYFDNSIVTDCFLRNYKGLTASISKDNLKKEMAKDSAIFADATFEQFKLVFDMILEIKAQEAAALPITPAVPSDPSEAPSGAAPALARASEALAAGAAG